MKKRFLLILPFALVAILLFNSCEPEAVNPPNLQVTPAETVMSVPGDVVSYQSIISSDTDLSSFGVMVKFGEILVATADSTFPASTQSAIIDFAFPIPDTISTATTITLTFEAKNESESTTLARTVEVSIPYGEINTYTAVILSDIENPNGSSFFSLEDNTLMQLATAITSSDKVDIIYYYGVANKATLCSPDDTDVEVFEDKNDIPIVSRFTKRNNTSMAAVEMSEEDFNAIVNDGPIMDNVPSEVGSDVPNLEIGDVLYAETEGGRKSLILVKNITGGQGTSEITIEVKIQQ